MVEYFGINRPAHKVSGNDAEDYKQWLIGRGMASSTVRKRLQNAKLFFGSMLKRKIITSNHFSGISMTAVIDEGRNVFVPREDIEKVLDAAPDADWRAIIALARYAGLRCPSEVLSLKWKNIDWQGGRITVTSPKTRQHPGGGQRVIPLN